MNPSIPAAISTELDSLHGPDQLQRCAELLRAMAESLDPGYRPGLLNLADDYEADAEQTRESEQAAREEHDFWMRHSPRYRREAA